MMAVVGILMALLERNRSGKGQVVEVDMVRLSLAPSARTHSRNKCRSPARVTSPLSLS